MALVDRTRDVALIVHSYNEQAGVWDCVAAVERLSALHNSVDFIFLSFGIMGFIVNFENIRGSLMRPKWPKLSILAQEICTH